MLNMSKEYYNYLAKRTVDFFQSAIVASGEKFILNFDTENEVQSFYDAIKEVINSNGGNSLEYVVHDDDEYRTIGLFTNSDVSVFVVPELNITQAYITRLRNTIKPNWAMLIISCNSIDSISRGTESLQKEGFPFCREKLIGDIKKLINNSDFDVAMKQILLFDLDARENGEYFDSFVISDYSDIITAINKTDIDDNDFKKFQLLSDKDIPTLSDEKDIRNRIKDNAVLYKQINDIVRFGDLERDLTKDFSEDFIKKVIDNHSKQEHWSDGITYTEVKKSQTKKDKSIKPLIIDKISVIADERILMENANYFVKHEAEKGAKANNNHILIFNTFDCTSFDIEITFSDTIGGNKTLTVTDKKMDTDAKVSGKKLIISQSHSGISINRVDLKCPDRSNSNFKISFCIINCNVSWFKSISTIYSIEAVAKKKRPKSLVICCSDEEIILNAKQETGSTIQLEDDLELYCDNNNFTKFLINEGSFNDDGIIYTSLHINNDVLSIQFKEETPINKPCSGIRIEQKKHFKKQSFVYRSENKLVMGTDEYNTQGELKENLALETEIIKNRILSCDFFSIESIHAIDLNINSTIKEAYLALIDYCRLNDTLPSLIYYNDDFSTLALNYVNAVFSELSEFEENKPLTKSQQDILRIGVVHYPEKNMIAYFPFHPLNVAYQLLLAKESANMKQEIRDEILKKLCSDNLLPMIRDNNGLLYKILDQKHSPQWTYYCKANGKKNNGSREYVSAIVKEKILEFYEHFRYLFDSVGGNKIIINAINMGDCHNLFKGIIGYYLEQYKNDKAPESMLTIVVNVYNNDFIHNDFECLGHKPLVKKFIDEQEIHIDKNHLSESELINCLVSKIKYYRKDLNDSQYEYCHLSFIEMDQETKEDFSNHNDIRSGAMLNGLISGVSSTYYGETHSYRTGYGSKFNSKVTGSKNLMALTDFYNSAMYVFGRSNPYNANNVLCTSIDEKETEAIEKTYDSSNWVVFIDPKVDLNFFKKADKDIMIIHYSDQHTTSSGYDAITVTRKTEQYANILKEYLHDNNLPTGNLDNVREMIDMFNAVNGDWLLKLISANENFQKEKISIQSAIKLALAFFNCENIIWIPISLEEILRVSGAVGLKQSDGLFSAQALGYDKAATSDDLLLFGVENRQNQVYVHLYPLEVKIGYKNADEITKATAQIKRTKEILDTQLCGDVDILENTLQYKFYRNFFAQLAVISAEKLNLYNVWNSQDWEQIVNTDIRGKLLNDEFIISNDLRNELGNGIIISFKEGTYMREVSKNEVTILKFLRDDGIKYLTKSVDDIIDDLQKMDDVSSQLFCKIHKTPDTQSSISTDDSTNISLDTLDENEGKSNNVDNSPVPIDSCIKSSEGMKILFGHDVNSGIPIYWYPNNTEKVMHPNTGIIGTVLL